MRSPVCRIGSNGIWISSPQTTRNRGRDNPGRQPRTARRKGTGGGRESAFQRRFGCRGTARLLFRSLLRGLPDRGARSGLLQRHCDQFHEELSVDSFAHASAFEGDSGEVSCTDSGVGVRRLRPGISETEITEEVSDADREHGGFPWRSVRCFSPRRVFDFSLRMRLKNTGIRCILPV